MITLNKLAYNIKNLAYGSSHSTEEDLDIRQIKHWVHYHRAKIIAENINKGILNHHALYQQYQLNAYTYFHKAVIEYINDWIAWNEDITGNITEPDIGSDVYGEQHRFFLQNFPKWINNPNTVEFHGLFIVESGMTKPPVQAYQNWQQQYNRNPYGKAKKDRQLTGDWRNNGTASFAIPEVLMIDNYRSIKDIELERNTFKSAYEIKDNAVDVGDVMKQGNPHAPFSVPVKTGVGKRFINHPVAQIDRNPTIKINQEMSTELDKDKYLLKISNLQASPSYNRNTFNTTQGTDNAVLWAYKGCLHAIFTDPTKVTYDRYRSDWPTSHWDDDLSPYPIPMEYVYDLIQRVLSVEVRSSISNPSDFLNDATDTTKLMSMQKQQSGS